jgi:hypothetical protein
MRSACRRINVEAAAVDWFPARNQIILGGEPDRTAISAKSTSWDTIVNPFAFA